MGRPWAAPAGRGCFKAHGHKEKMWIELKTSVGGGFAGWRHSAMDHKICRLFCPLLLSPQVLEPELLPEWTWTRVSTFEKSGQGLLHSGRAHALGQKGCGFENSPGCRAIFLFPILSLVCPYTGLSWRCNTSDVPIKDMLSFAAWGKASFIGTDLAKRNILKSVLVFILPVVKLEKSNFHEK